MAREALEEGVEVSGVWDCGPTSNSSHRGPRTPQLLPLSRWGPSQGSSQARGAEGQLYVQEQQQVALVARVERRVHAVPCGTETKE